MDKKQTAIIVTVAASLLCGCPGLSALCFGAFFAAISQIPGAEINVFGSSDPATALTTGLSMVCGGLIFVIIPIIIGFVMLRKKPDQAPISDEPIPPAI